MRLSINSLKIRRNPRNLNRCEKSNKILMSDTPHRRNPLRLIINKQTQLRILWLVWGAVFFCMGLTALMVLLGLEWVWMTALLISVGTMALLWVSREIAGPLHRIEKDLEALLRDATSGIRV